jgi:transcriptional regulator with XRE-family HTH domain
MAKKTAPLLPGTQQLLAEFGERLKLARLRRKLTAKQVAERAGMTPMTLRSLEAGGAGVTIGAYLSVMQVLGLENDMNKLAAEDKLGRQLQDSRLIKRAALFSTHVTPLHDTPESEYPSPETVVVVKEEESGKQVSPEAAAAPPQKLTGTTSADLASLLKPLKNPTEGNK